jgi:putative FmdB family regulatory protein
LPTYVYRCTGCGAGYELRESFSAPASHPCPECGQLSRRVPVAPPILFKGSGFHKTDNRSTSGSRNGASSTPSEKTEKTEKTEASGDGAKSTESTATKASTSDADTEPTAAGSA